MFLVLLLAGAAAADPLYTNPHPVDWSTLPIQIGTIVGAYVAFLALVGIGFIFARRRRYRMQRIALREVDVKRRTVVEYVSVSEDLKSNDARKRAMEMENLYPVRGERRPSMPLEKPHTSIPARGSVASKASKKESMRNVRISAPIAPPELHKRFEAYKRASDEEPLSKNADPPSQSEALRGYPVSDRRSPPMDALRSSPAVGHTRRQPSVSSINSQNSHNYSRRTPQPVDNRYQPPSNDRSRSIDSRYHRAQSTERYQRPTLNTDLPEPPRPPGSRHGSITSPQREPTRQNSLTSVRSFSRPITRNQTPVQSPESGYGPFSDRSPDSSYGNMNRPLPFRQNSTPVHDIPREVDEPGSAKARGFQEFNFEEVTSSGSSTRSGSRPLPFREIYETSSPKASRSPLPFRSEEPDRIVNTVLERKPKTVPQKSLGLLSPTTPFTPFSPSMPVSPRLVTREERKHTQRTMGSLAQELAKSDAELWDV